MCVLISVTYLHHLLPFFLPVYNQESRVRDKVRLISKMHLASIASALQYFPLYFIHKIHIKLKFHDYFSFLFGTLSLFLSILMSFNEKNYEILMIKY